MARNLLEAIFSGDERLARDILTRGTYANIDFRLQNQPGTALFCSSVRGYLSLVRLLLTYGADANARNENEATPLHGAVDNGHSDIVRVLLQHGAKVNARTQRGDSPLHLAAYRGFSYIAYDLIMAGADVIATNTRAMTPEMEAAGQGHANLAEYLKAVEKAQYPGSKDESCHNSSVLVLDPPQQVLAERSQNKERQHQAEFSLETHQQLTKKQRRKEGNKNSDHLLSPTMGETFRQTVSSASLGTDSVHPQKDLQRSPYMQCMSCLNSETQRNDTVSESNSNFRLGQCSCQTNVGATGPTGSEFTFDGKRCQSVGMDRGYDSICGLDSRVCGQESRRSPVESDDNDCSNRLSPSVRLVLPQPEQSRCHIEPKNNMRSFATTAHITQQLPNYGQAQLGHYNQAFSYPNAASLSSQESKHTHVQNNLQKDSSHEHSFSNQAITTQASPQVFLLSSPLDDSDTRPTGSKNSVEHISPQFKDYTYYHQIHDKNKAAQAACLPPIFHQHFLKPCPLGSSDFSSQSFKSPESKVPSAINKRRTSVGSIESAFSDSSSGGGSRSDVSSIAVSSGSDLSSMLLSDVSESGDDALILPSCRPPPYCPELDSQRCNSYPVLRDVGSVDLYVPNASDELQSRTMKCITLPGVYFQAYGNNKTWLSSFVPSGPPTEHLNLYSLGTKEVPKRSLSAINPPTMPAVRSQQSSSAVKQDLARDHFSSSLRQDNFCQANPTMNQQPLGLRGGDHDSNSRSERCVSVDAGMACNDMRGKKAIYRTHSANETSRRDNDICRAKIEVPVHTCVGPTSVYDKMGVDPTSLIVDSLEDVREKSQSRLPARSDYNSASDYDSGNPSLSSVYSEETSVPSINLNGVDDSGTHSSSMSCIRSELSHVEPGAPSSLLRDSKYPRVTRVNSCPIPNFSTSSTAGVTSYFISQKCSSSSDCSNVSDSNSNSSSSSSSSRGRSSSTERNSSQGSQDTAISKLTSSDNSTYSAEFSNETTSSSLNDLSRLSPLPLISQGSDSGIPLPSLNSHQSISPVMTCVNIPFQ